MRSKIETIGDLIEVLEIFKARYGNKAMVAQIGCDDTPLPINRAEVYGSDFEVDGGDWYGIDEPTLILW